MKTLKLTLFFMLFAAFAAAQARIVPASQEQNMRIFTKDGEDSIVYFPSAYLDYKPKINVVFPQGYSDDAQARFCSVYIINKEEMPKNSVYSTFSKEDAGKCIYVNIRFNSIPSSKALEGFLTRELLPYIEVNYKTVDRPDSKVLLAGEGYSSSVINVLPSLSNYFDNFALLFYASTAMPANLEGVNKDVSIWSLGPLGNMLRLQTLLENAGLKFYKNFAYRIIAGENNNAPSFDKILNLRYLLDKESCTPLKAKAVFSKKNAGATSEESFNFWLDIKGKKGFMMNYVPPSFKIAPPFLSWDFKSASLKVIYGAQPGKVKLSGFAGDILPFDASFKITK